MRRLALFACALGLLGCPGQTGKRPPREQDPPPPTSPAPSGSPQDPELAEKDAPPKEGTPADGNAKLLPGAALPITALLGKTPPQAQEHLGEPTGKGMTRESCLRRVPEKTWFACKYVYQRYEDTTSTYTAIQVVYEDGKAASVAFEGVPGDGEFDPVKALARVGIELPGKPTLRDPAPNVKLWSWFNNAARLVLDGKQHRVEVSAVSGQWRHSKVEVFLNHPLSPQQQARVISAKDAEPKGEQKAG